MKALMIWPKHIASMQSLEGMHKLIGVKSQYVPLPIVTVAALLPQEWDFRVVDCNIKTVSDDDWNWADIVLISGMMTQRDDQSRLIQQAKAHDKLVAVGGPFATSVPHVPTRAGADFLVLDEGEITIPEFVEALNAGETSGVFRANGRQADMTQSPMPRYDLLNFDNYMTMCVQFSRGCPYLCEFCDIPHLFGRTPRTKTPGQMTAELTRLMELGWNEMVFIADDNLIGNKKLAKSLLRELVVWQQESGGLALSAEASLNVADDPKLLQLMQDANIRVLFIGIESPEEELLRQVKKQQNCNHSMIERIHRIYEYGFRVVSGMIIGFDNEAPGADRRILNFLKEAAIPVSLVSMMTALPNTPLSARLEKEGRLFPEVGENGSMINCDLTNFSMTRPLAEVASEFVNCIETIYEPVEYYERLRRHCLISKIPPRRKKRKLVRNKYERKIAFNIIWNQGFRRPGRWKFWSSAFDVARKNPLALRRFAACCGQLEHFYNYREQVKRDVWRSYEALGDYRFKIHEPGQSKDHQDDGIRVKLLAS